MQCEAGETQEPATVRKDAKNAPPKSEKEVAKQKLIDRIQKRFDEDERNPAVRSQTELVFAEITEPVCCPHPLDSPCLVTSTATRAFVYAAELYLTACGL